MAPPPNAPQVPPFWWRWWAWLLDWWRPSGPSGRPSRPADTATAPRLSLRQRAALLGLGGPAKPAAPPDVWQQAQALVRAIDAGGLPLSPARVNAIARGLGLEVSAQAPMDQTVARIRAALQRPRH